MKFPKLCPFFWFTQAIKPDPRHVAIDRESSLLDCDHMYAVYSPNSDHNVIMAVVVAGRLIWRSPDPLTDVAQEDDLEKKLAA